MASASETLKRAVLFECPERIPMAFHINGACWNHYPQDWLQGLMADHPILFPGFTPSEKPVRFTFRGNACADRPYTDPWGCVWETSENGIVGAVVQHPLATYDEFESFRAPDPAMNNGHGPIDWEALEEGLKRAGEAGGLKMGSLHHGHTFLTLTDIRGYDSLIFDLVDERPEVFRLIEMVEAFNQQLVQRFLALGVEFMEYPEDLGMQVGPMISPDLFRRFILPSYERLMKPARDRGILVGMHSDGDIRDLVDDLISGGVQRVNLQDLVNGVEWIRDRLKGKV
ncbi:MAG: uroporphyrinogen decarboxylase family protein, partial [Planctomycetota bacterium]